jgi:hypothetical protein
VAKNIYYEQLLTSLNKKPTSCLDPSFCSFYAATPDNSTINLGGNISITSKIPISGIPNYFYVLINTLQPSLKNFYSSEKSLCKKVTFKINFNPLFIYI